MLVLVLALFTVGFPWYFVSYKDPAGSGCEVLTLSSWIDEYCWSKNCQFECNNKVNWQDACDDCDDRKRDFNITLGVVAISTFLALFVSLGFCVRCCSSSYKRRNPLHVIIAIFAFLFLTAGLVYFYIATPKNNACLNSGFPVDCDRFWGSNDQGFTWGPAGWVAGCFTAVIMAASLCLSCQRSGDEIDMGTYYSVGEHGDSYQHNYTHTTAGTNYAGTTYVVSTSN